MRTRACWRISKTNWELIKSTIEHSRSLESARKKLHFVYSMDTIKSVDTTKTYAAFDRMRDVRTERAKALREEKKQWKSEFQTPKSENFFTRFFKGWR